MRARLRIMPSRDEGPPPAQGQSAPADEEMVLQAALAGDDAAWATLIGRHHHRVLVALLGRGVPLDRAHELVQETWVRLMERQRAGRLDELRLPGLAIVQAGFLAMNDWRRQERQQPLPAPAQLPCAHDLEEAVIDKQRLGRVSRALAACPPSARRVFEMVYDNPDLSYAEVAARVGLSVQRVKQIVFEVRKRLRAAMDGSEEEGA